MSGPPSGAPRILVVGGCGGLVGRAILEEFRPTHRIRSVHRHPNDNERAAGVEFVSADVGRVSDWAPYLAGVDTVLNLIWYREGRNPNFVPVRDSLVRLVPAAERAGVRRFVHVSVPDAPAPLERELPYLALRREVDRALAASRLDFAIVRPTMLFGPGDKLATVMLRTIHRFGRLPLYGDGQYHLSPVATRDLARALRLEGERGARATTTVGGPRRYTYVELGERMFEALGRRPRYLRMSPANGVRLARLLEAVGSTLIYAYEVEWLVSDMLGVSAYKGLDRPLQPIEPFLAVEAARLTGRPVPATPGAA